MCGQEKIGQSIYIYFFFLHLFTSAFIYSRNHKYRSVCSLLNQSVWMTGRKTGRLILIFYQYLGKDLMILSCFRQQEEPAEEQF